MSLDGLRKMAGVEATRTGIVIGRSSTGAGELEEIPFASLADGIAAASAFAQTLLDDADATAARATLGAQAAHASLTSLSTAAIALAGDYSDGTVLAALVAILVTKGIITDTTTP